MITGLGGTLLSHEALEQLLRDDHPLLADGGASHAARARLRQWHLAVRAGLGPAAAARTVFDRLAVPLFRHLGYRILPTGGSSDLLKAALESGGAPAVGLVVTGWGREDARIRRQTVTQGIALDVPWSVCVTGPAVRIVDSRRTYSRRTVEFALDEAMDDERTFRVFWSLLGAGAMRRGAEPILDRLVTLSERHRSQVRDALQSGVEEALVRLLQAFRTATNRRAKGAHTQRPAFPGTFDEALVVIYRILFLLFAEARALVPRWHPVFRDGYTIEALRDGVERQARPAGLWEALQAIARLAHAGCEIGALKVPPFNGRLFSPAHSPLADTVPLDDGVVREAVLALTTRPVRRGRVRVSYGDLGVEQLGGVYERLLDLEPSPAAPALIRSERRKASGSFYTPRSLTEFVVRRTLAPLVAGASPERILDLRVLDPAMGSGAFLVAACRYLASAYEAALVREGGCAMADITEPERAEFRRAVAGRCLFGVDVNPMAVQLGRLSLWLATMAADRPLTFLDHRLRAGNSLVGASLDDLRRQPTASGRDTRPAALPLFDDEHAFEALGGAVAVRARIAGEPDDTPARVRAKEQALADLEGRDAALARWKLVADVWCAGWFRSRPDQRKAAALFGALSDIVLGGRRVLAPGLTEPLLDEARAIAAAHRFFHWTLEFPETFYGADGRRLDRPGFDAVLGNPPWEMLRGDRGTPEARSGRRRDASQLTAFARTAGVYRLQGGGHANLYQLFLERALTLVRAGGRLGLVLPHGLAIDCGSAHLRGALFDRTRVDSLVSIENREGMFPIHRGLKFLVVSATTGGRTERVACRSGIRRPAALDEIADEGLGPGAIELSRALIERMSGPSLAVPDLHDTRDVEIAGDLAFRWPSLGSPDGWEARFGRELNATDDRPHFVERSRSLRGALPVLDGKHVSPFAVDTAASSLGIRAAAAARLLNGARTFERPRLGYRDVASPTNRLSLIAAIIPAGVVTTHTILCLKTALDDEAQAFLCGIFNSFVANYLVRPRIATHVGAAVIARLPVPGPGHDAAARRRIANLAAALGRSASAVEAATLQAWAARLYGLTRAQFAHVLDTFPLVSMEERRAAMEAFCDIVS